MLDFFLHQESHRGLLDELRDAGRAGMRAMRRTEGVVHINVAEFGQRFGKLRIVRFFPRLKAKIFEQGHVAFAHVPDDFLRDRADRVVTENHRMIDQHVQMIGHGPKRIFLDRLSFRPAEVRHQNRLRAVLAKVINRRQTFTDPRVIGDDDPTVLFFDRHIEVHAHERALAAHLEIAKGEFLHFTW